MTLFQECFSSGETASRPPFWFMRQAGRYLPEYRAIREKSEGFLELCYTPEKAAEVTLQPIARFGMDAAIHFSDILVIPHALGMEVRFTKGEGPKIARITRSVEVEALTPQIEAFLSPVYESVRLTREKLPPEKALIGFAGAPWTLACYMLEGQGGGSFKVARRALYATPELPLKLVEVLVEAVSRHLIAQVQAGADALQLFDSWAGLVPAPWQEKMIFFPTREIVRRVKQVFPKIPIIGFPRGQGAAIGDYVRETGVDGVGIDTETSLAYARKAVPDHCVIQGNLDPLLLVLDRGDTVAAAKKILRRMQGRRFIFNLGHGVLPDTPVAHMQALVEALTDGRPA